MPDPPSRLSVADLRQDPDLYRILLEHAYRGVRIQMLLRGALAVFVLVTVVAAPPAHERTASYATAAAYAAWTVALGWVSQREGERPVRLVWLALFIDVAVLATLSLLASSSEQSWTADILLNAFFVVPMLATAQLRPGVGTAVTAPALLVYLGASIAARHANAEPWTSVLLRTGVLAALSAGAVLLSWQQRSRVLTIAALAADRTELVGDLADVEVRARRDLAEELHDGALQYVLAARQDLTDARDRGTPGSFERVDEALRESSALLRAKVSQLHPAVLEHSGLLRAVDQLLRDTAERSGARCTLEACGWDETTRTVHDELLYSVARELLTNVAKHAGARTVQVTLARGEGRLVLSVADDGVGVSDGTLDRKVAEGHIGVVSLRVRAEAVGGRLTYRPAHPGTVAEVTVPDRP
jgi:two-component system NarL family sensor kinase